MTTFLDRNPWPKFTDAQISKAISVLQSGKVNYWTGTETKLFEQEFSSWCRARHSLAVSNGSLALTASYLACGLSPGDEFITTPRTFIATSSAGVLLQATPIFADVDRNSGSITAETIAPLITPKTRLISVVHLGGWPADMPSICDLARSHSIPVVEDCAQAHGAAIDGQPVGSFGDVAAWSFCQDKIMSTAGEGGMVTTSNPSYMDLIWSLRDHGKTLRSLNSSSGSQVGFRWLHDRFGSNFRLTEIQSAIGRLQLHLLPEWTSLRTRNALILSDALKEISSIYVPLPPANLTHAWYKFYAFVQHHALADGWSRDRIIHEISSLGFPAYSGSCSEIYREKCFRDRHISPLHRLPVASSLGESSLMFLVHPTIPASQMHLYAESIRDVLRKSTR